MPLPKTSDIEMIMKVLNREGGRSRRQKIAIALRQARKYGSDIPLSKQMRDMKRG